MPPELLRFLQQLNGYMHYQNQQIQQMDERIQGLIQEFNRFKEKYTEPPVIRNEYRFDLLKVEKLEGTLNIGINPNGAENGSDSSIEEFAIGQSMEVPSMIEKQYPQLYPGVKQQVDDYLNNGAFESLKQLENQYSHPLDDQYRKFILEDVRNQIDNRIRDYLKRIHPEEAAPKQLTYIQQSVYEDVKRDIDKTFETFLRNLLRKENGS
ncbi:spore germination protein GerPC [Paenibacillus sp. sptzw28]|uniref:spore germination protein GerPC n=1 Tax=Paenibacillus sp. sptzw28 TaxID=715179 RepID=UPI001C6E5555|nr:spore germination protein GerPC [Paenibacillus sp. sptzw28]QYR22592.1 spore germination protein GerPC [Paenibacillus sp. sptzw28]